MIVVGIEEAGRGPVIGPLVMVITSIDKDKEEELVSMGVKDSKLLTPSQRYDLFDKIKLKLKGYKIVIISPKEIDKTLETEGTNLNFLEADTSVKLIKDMSNNLKIDRVILDCPSTNTSAYRDYVKHKLKDPKIEIIAEHKADVLYPIVSAASILAKVTRDNEVKKIRGQIGIDFGSGYPSDPKTVKFLEENYDKYDDIFRKTWVSYKRHVNKKNQNTLDSY